MSDNTYPDVRHIHDNYIIDAITGELVPKDIAVEDEDGHEVHPKNLERDPEEHAIDVLFELLSKSVETPNQDWIVVHGELPPWHNVYGE